MGAQESTTGFYNDRKIIRYEDGTTEYPEFCSMPPYQIREWQEAEAKKRRQTMLSLKADGDFEEPYEHYDSEEILPENIPFDKVAIAHFMIDKEQQEKRRRDSRKSLKANNIHNMDESFGCSETEELLTTDDSRSLDHSRNESNRNRFKMRQSTSTMSSSSYSDSYMSFNSAFGLLTSKFQAENRKNIWYKCPVNNWSNVFTILRDFRKKRCKVHDENEASYEYSQCSQVELQNLQKIPIGVQSSSSTFVNNHNYTIF